MLADGAMHAASAARKHLAGVKYEDVPTSKPTKRATGVVPQKPIGTRSVRKVPGCPNLSALAAHPVRGAVS